MEWLTARKLTVPEGRKRTRSYRAAPGAVKADLSCSTVSVGLISVPALTEGPQSLGLFCEGFWLMLGKKYSVAWGAV